jgi:hypothetical protein
VLRYLGQGSIGTEAQGGGTEGQSDEGDGSGSEWARRWAERRLSTGPPVVGRTAEREDSGRPAEEPAQPSLPCSRPRCALPVPPQNSLHEVNADTE